MIASKVTSNKKADDRQTMGETMEKRTKRDTNEIDGGIAVMDFS